MEAVADCAGGPTRESEVEAKKATEKLFEAAEVGIKTKIPGDGYFALGDNSASSRDSRYWGFFPFKDILGKAVLVWWPPKRIKLIR